MFQMGLGYQELLIVLVIIFFLFGGSRLPELARGLGQSLRAFKEGQAAGEKEALEHGPPRGPAAIGTAEPESSAASLTKSKEGLPS